MTPEDPFRVVIAGGGVAALEAALALRELAGERVSLQLLAPDPMFTYRPVTVAEPFGHAPAGRYPLADIAGDIGADLITDGLRRVEPERQIAYTEEGAELPYDALLIAVGALMRPPFRHALTIDDRRMDELLRGVVQDVEGGYVRRLAFIAPAGMAWPLPLYELALMTARRAYESNEQVAITIVTPEDRPLALFGEQVGRSVAKLLQEAGIATITSAWVQVPASGKVVIHPSNRRLDVDRIIALPQLFGPALSGLPRAEHGFIPVDVHGQVRGVPRVYAAGDATDFAVKYGGVAAQQADAAAETIAALAGAPVTPTPFHPELHGILLTGGRPLFMSARITGGHGFDSQIADEPTWEPAAKIASRYLAPYLHRLDCESALV